MIVQEDFLKKLRSAFDLNIYEVKIWTALLSRGIATAGELSDISNVPRSRSYDVLESLEKKGFIIMKLGKPIKYIAVQPTEIIKRVKKNILTESDRQLKSLEKIKTEKVYSELELLYKQGIDHVDPTNLSGALRGRDNLYGHFQGLVSNAKSSVTIVTSTEGFVRKAEMLKNTFKKAKANGVKIKIAAPITTDEAKKAAKDLKGVAEVRNVNRINARFVIVDRENLMFMIANDQDIHESYDCGVWVNSPYFANALDMLFGITWQNLQQIK